MRVIGGEKGNSRAPYAEHAPRERNPRNILSSNGSTVGGSCRWSVSPAFGTGTIQWAQCHEWIAPLSHFQHDPLAVQRPVKDEEKRDDRQGECE